MATGNQVAASSATKQNNDGKTTVLVIPKRKVTYVLDISASSANLNMPYAIAVNGKALSVYNNKPARVSGNKGKIEVMVDAGKTVSLFLNSDARPSYRTQAVYAITPTDRNVVVTIKEKKGKHTDSDTPILKTKATEEGKPDEYTAPLTGDIWMKVSHKYSAAEAKFLTPIATSPAISTAVENIYEPLMSAILNIPVAAENGKPAMNIEIKFQDSENPKDNITQYSLLKDGLTRVHPAGYAALFKAAVENRIPSLTITSCWRPMVGSIAHRAGLGLDVNYVGTVRLNREELSKPGAVNTANVSEEEKRLFQELKQREKELADLKKTGASKEDIDNASKDRREANKRWEEERNGNEPDSVKKFRGSLLNEKQSVAQLFDPWYMDANTQDNVSATPNRQENGNEKLHAHHLHITVKEQKIL